MTGRLRTYARLPRESQKVKDGAEDFAAVYAEVDARSEGRCEVTLATPPTAHRCRSRAAHHHHLFKPRRSHHTANEVVHVCAADHDRMEWPYPRGRMCFIGRAGEAFLFALRYSASKFQARGQGE